MKDDRREKLKISNDLLDAMLVGVKTQDDLWGKEGIITHSNKALLERILNAEMDFHLNALRRGASQVTVATATAIKLSRAISAQWSCQLQETDIVLSSLRSYQSVPLKLPSLKRLSSPYMLKV